MSTSGEFFSSISAFMMSIESEMIPVSCDSVTLMSVNSPFVKVTSTVILPPFPEPSPENVPETPSLATVGVVVAVGVFVPPHPAKLSIIAVVASKEINFFIFLPSLK